MRALTVRKGAYHLVVVVVVVFLNSNKNPTNVYRSTGGSAGTRRGAMGLGKGVDGQKSNADGGPRPGTGTAPLAARRQGRGNPQTARSVAFT